uniref:C-type lectin domain family 4 member M-like n=1 Tax=Sinocyclocheilus rhinocerous TaxID=307959 RepID=A0A673KXN1_9TELE
SETALSQLLCASIAICVFWSCLSGGSRYLRWITVGLGVICVLLLVFIILNLQDSYTDLMTEKHQLQDNFNSLSQKKLELETRIKDLTDEKDQLQRDFDSLNKKGTVCFFMSTELKSWSDCRQYCRDRGADLVIINTEEKQVSFERVWIGLSDTENEGIMKWVDNSPLKQGFWFKGEPNNSNGNEDCIELNYNREETGWSPLNSWNDYPCSEKKKGICEK